MWSEIILPKTRPILVGVCYRPPKQNNFYELSEMVCNECNNFKKYELILLGDFNTNVQMPARKNALVDSLTNFNSLFGLKPLISKPTRSCPTSVSTIDLIMVSDHEKISQSGIIDIGLSDHTVIYCTRKTTKVPLTQNCNPAKVRSLKRYSKELFTLMLSKVNWSDALY